MRGCNPAGVETRVPTTFLFILPRSSPSSASTPPRHKYSTTAWTRTTRGVIIQNIFLRSSDFRNVFTHPAWRTQNRSDSFLCGVTINVQGSVTIRYCCQQIGDEKIIRGNRWYDRIYDIWNLYKTIRPSVEEMAKKGYMCILAVDAKFCPVTVYAV